MRRRSSFFEKRRLYAAARSRLLAVSQIAAFVNNGLTFGFFGFDRRLDLLISRAAYLSVIR